ncbi:TPA: CDP-glycerol:glycerophosphate glycerophosphotransferase [Campylobacter coli]|uniref:CDP-glycerol glycerophosphotransferase family protein n=4 Tax=Campylobacter coli TaxID=195 RepID=UPI001ECA41D2|nr:glycosyltransferase [Campylobacter coli]MEC4262197.1 CDP-glycerol glycerophosphotransferase family protein [Campylobacter coli]
MSVFKKTKKLFKDPKLFFKDAIEKKVFWLSGVYNKYLPKKHKGFTQYAIISAVYNVEKYLDDYFKSIINQRLDFKKNIFMILVDDGSTDNSAQIIKKYQKKYPKNIVYLYKENGGQASARNLGLKYMQENNYKAPWVTFTDPDDFLDRNYFYEVDKFLSAHQDDDICMISTKTVFYDHEKQTSYDHPMKDLKWHSDCIVDNKNFLYQMPAAPTTLFLYKEIQKYNIRFREGEHSRYGFEDVEFSLLYFLYNFYNSTLFLKSSIYFYRKNHGTNTTFKALQHKEYYIGTQNRIMQLHRLFSKIEKDLEYYKNIILYYSFFPIKSLINSPEKLSFMSESEKQRYLELLDQNFSYIDKNTILNFYKIPGFNFFYQVGILNCFKNEKPPFQIAYIEDYDPCKEQILITYYTGDDKDIESIRIDNEVIYADYENIVKYDFLDRVFCYQKRLWVHIPKNAKDRLDFTIDKEQVRITFNGKKYQSLFIQDIRKEFQKRLPKSNIWLLMDRDYEADDNAEHLYRYIMQNHPEQEIVFALRKESSDWERLEKEGFNLIEFGSYEFERIAKKASKVISSHSDDYLMKYITPRQQFIFLQHGVTYGANISTWFNSLKINYICLCNTREFANIALNYSNYNIGLKEAKNTGFARHDRLLKLSKKNNKKILVMPTWRKYIVGNVIHNTGIRNFNSDFLTSEYFLKWKHFLHSEKLKYIIEKYNYEIIFFPHFQSRPYLEYFETPSYISLNARENGESLQKVFASCDLMITDYSTASSEMAIQNKPILYYQFDEFDVDSGKHHKREKSFDFRIHGYGPVVINEEELFCELEYLLENDCKVRSFHQKNIDRDFKFRDGNNCKRIYESIVNMSIFEIANVNDVISKAQRYQDKMYFAEAFYGWKNIFQNLAYHDSKTVFNLLYCARKSFLSHIVIDLIKSDFLVNKNDVTKVEYIENLIICKKYKEALRVLENLNIPNSLDFILIKLKLLCTSNELQFKDLYNTIIENKWMSETELNQELFLFQCKMIDFLDKIRENTDNVASVIYLNLLKLIKQD